MTGDIFQLKNFFRGHTCVIVGSGPSLLKVDKSYFGTEDVVIALNNAIVRIEFLELENLVFSMQKDCAIWRPNDSVLLVSEHESKTAFEDYEPRFVFDVLKLFQKNELPYGHEEFSANVALRISQLFGCSKIKLVAFDACTVGNVQNASLEGIIYNDPNGRFLLEQCTRMYKRIEQDKLNVEWVK